MKLTTWIAPLLLITALNTWAAVRPAPEAIQSALIAEALHHVAFELQPEGDRCRQTIELISEHVRTAASDLAFKKTAAALTVLETSKQQLAAMNSECSEQTLTRLATLSATLTSLINQLKEGLC